MTKPVSDDVSFRVLRMLQDTPDLSQRQIASALGVSVGVVNYCLRALAQKGQIKVRNFQSSDNKLRYAYILTPRGMAEKTRLTGAFLKRKMAEYEALKAEIASLETELAPERVTTKSASG
jgi:EPS-associated MarR family transcriptional regulator